METDKRRARQALRNYKRMLALEPSHTGHLEQIARLLVELGDHRQAARYFLQRAEVLEARDEPAAALASVRAALECDPQNPRARDMLSLLRRTAPPDEILLPEGDDAGLLPVNDALLATDDPALRSDGIELEDDESFMRDAFLPPARRTGARPARPARPIEASDDISAIVARLSAGLARQEPSQGPPAAAVETAPPGDSNELVSDLADVSTDSLVGENRREFMVERVDDAVVGESTVENRVGRFRRDDDLELLTSGEIEVLDDLEDRSLDVAADQVIEVRPESGALPEVAPRAGEYRVREAAPQLGSAGGARGSSPAVEASPSRGVVRVEPGAAERRALYDRRLTDRRAASRRVEAAPARDEAPPTRDLRVDAAGLDSAGFDLGASADTDVDAALDHHQGRSLHEDYAAYRREQLSRPVEARFHAGHIRLSSLFAALPRPVLDRLIAGAEHRTVRIGVPIVRAGDRFEGPFVLTRGRIAREKETDGRRRALLTPIEPGDLFGLVELVRGGRWRTTARAELECDILRLPVRAVDEARGDHARWEQTLRDVAARRLADELLAGSGLFGHMDPGLRSTLGQKFTMRVFGSGEMLIEPGERVDGLFLVIAGEVDVEQDDAYLTTLGSGDLVGIVAALEKTPTRVRAVAATPVEAFHLGEEALRVALAVPEVHAAFTAAVERRRSVLEGGQY